jgi:hypothetical protein
MASSHIYPGVSFGMLVLKRAERHIESAEVLAVQL